MPTAGMHRHGCIDSCQTCFLQVPINVAETKFNDMIFWFPEEPLIIVSQAAKQPIFFAMEKKPKKKRAKLPRKARTIDGVHQILGLQCQ